MTAYYFANAGSDGNNGLTPETPKRDPSLVALSPNDQMFLNAGEQHDMSAAIYQLANGVSIGRYGVGDVNPIVRATNADSWGALIIPGWAGAQSGITVTDVQVTHVADTQPAIILDAAQSLPLSNITLRRVKGFGALDGIYVNNPGPSQSYPTATRSSDILLDSCEFSNNARHGFFGLGATLRLTVLESIADGNGYKSYAYGSPTGPGGVGQGITAREEFAQVNEPWTSMGGGVYKAAIPAWRSSTAHLAFAQGTPFAYRMNDAAVPTAPAAGEFGVDVGANEIYVNLGGIVPGGGVIVSYCYGLPIEDLLYDQCVTKNTLCPGENPIYGHGFGFDVGAKGRAKRCLALNNYADGFYINYQAWGDIESSVMEGNGWFGAAFESVSGGSLTNCTIRGGGQNNQQVTAAVAASGRSKDIALKNSILFSAGRPIVANQPGTVLTNCSAGTIVAMASQADSVGIIPTDLRTVATSDLNVNYRIPDASLMHVCPTTTTVLDYYGNAFGTPNGPILKPTPGAVEWTRAEYMAIRSFISRNTARRA